MKSTFVGYENERFIRHEIAEHQILLSFYDDVGAEAFDDWWRNEGAEEFANWVNSNEQFASQRKHIQNTTK